MRPALSPPPAGAFPHIQTPPTPPLPPFSSPSLPSQPGDERPPTAAVASRREYLDSLLCASARDNGDGAASAAVSNPAPADSDPEAEIDSDPSPKKSEAAHRAGPGASRFAGPPEAACTALSAGEPAPQTAPRVRGAGPPLRPPPRPGPPGDAIPGPAPNSPSHLSESSVRQRGQGAGHDPSHPSHPSESRHGPCASHALWSRRAPRARSPPRA